MTDEDRTPDADNTDATDVSDVADDVAEPDEAIDVAEDADDTDDAADESDSSSEPVARTAKRKLWARVTVAAMAVLLIASAGLTGWLYMNEFRPDRQTDPAAAQVALDAAKSGTVALLSYSPDTLDKDFAAAKTRLTGDFLSYYTQFTEQIVTPAAREKSVKTEASVVRAAVSEIKPESAEVLVFINQTTTSKENPDGAFAASSVKVGLKKIDGNWLIASFDPV